MKEWICVETSSGLYETKELVRCKNCKWRWTEACFCKAKKDTQDEWFCSEGESV